MASGETRQFRPLLGSESRKRYNNTDSKQQLVLIEVGKERFGGYKRDLLVNPLTEVEIDFYVCITCQGIMRYACHVGEEQTPVCQDCVREGVCSQPMMKSRKKIPQLVVKCPLTTRGCNWNGTIAELEEHLNVCVEFVIKCRDCEIILQRSEVVNHLTNSCGNRGVVCRYCDTRLLHRYLIGHYDVCTEHQVYCPNDCRAVLKRRQLKVHMDTECPNTPVECSYKMFGCNQKMKRCELEEHGRTNEIKHLKSTTLYSLNKMEQMEKKIASSDNAMQQMKRESEMTKLQMEKDMRSSENKIQQMEQKIVSSDKIIEQMKQKIGCSDKILHQMEQKIVSSDKIIDLMEQKIVSSDKIIDQMEQKITFCCFEIQQIAKTNPTKAINELEKHVTTIKASIDKLLYPVVLRDTFKVETILLNNPAYKIKCGWNSHKIHVAFINKEGEISVTVKMESDNTRATWFEGRFKLTICDKKDIENSLLYETPVVKLQFQQLGKPSFGVYTKIEERSPQKQLATELVIAEVPQDLIFNERFVRNNEITYILQIQKADDLLMKV